MDFIKLLILTIFEVLLPFIMAAIVILWFYSCYTALKNIINFIGNVRRYNNKYIAYYTANRTRIIKTSLHSIIIISLYIFIIYYFSHLYVPADPSIYIIRALIAFSLFCSINHTFSPKYIPRSFLFLIDTCMLIYLALFLSAFY